MHFYRNIFSITPRKKMKAVVMMLKAIHAQKKARQVAEKLQEMKLSIASKKLQDGIDETLIYMDFPPNTGRGAGQTIRLNA